MRSKSLHHGSLRWQPRATIWRNDDSFIVYFLSRQRWCAQVKLMLLIVLLLLYKLAIGTSFLHSLNRSAVVFCCLCWNSRVVQILQFRDALFSWTWWEQDVEAGQFTQHAFVIWLEYLSLVDSANFTSDEQDAHRDLLGGELKELVSISQSQFCKVVNNSINLKQSASVWC